jgi:hypothetical protein
MEVLRARGMPLEPPPNGKDPCSHGIGHIMLDILPTLWFMGHGFAWHDRDLGLWVLAVAWWKPTKPTLAAVEQAGASCPRPSATPSNALGRCRRAAAHLSNSSEIADSGHGDYLEGSRMKLLTETCKTAVLFEGDAAGKIYQADTIEYEGKFWLVPEWIEDPDTQCSRPLRIVPLDLWPHQKTPALGGFVINVPISRALFEGRVRQPESPHQVVDWPDVGRKLSSARH